MDSQILTTEQSDLLSAVLNCIVPAEDAMPGAGDIGVAAFIDEAMAQALHLRKPILSVVSRLPDLHDFNALSDEGRDSLLRRIEAEHPEAFQVLLQAAYNGYYSHPHVLEAIGWTPPNESGYEMEAFDPAMLEDVRRRGPIYKHI